MVAGAGPNLPPVLGPFLNQHGPATHATNACQRPRTDSVHGLAPSRAPATSMSQLTPGASQEDRHYHSTRQWVGGSCQAPPRALSQRRGTHNPLAHPGSTCSLRTATPTVGGPSFGVGLLPRYRVSAEHAASLMAPMADRDEAMDTTGGPGVACPLAHQRLLGSSLLAGHEQSVGHRVNPGIPVCGCASTPPALAAGQSTDVSVLWGVG